MANAFRTDELEGRVALVTFDTPEKKVNTLSAAVLQELATLVGQLERRSDLRGLLFRSGKPNQFIAGADLNELAALSYLPKEQVTAALAFGHGVFERISRLPYPTVALIDGNSLGGGTELALSFDERLASTSPETTIGLPEVKIGLLPGWGGTQRLPRLIGLHHAIEMITSGEPVHAQKAATLGLVFDAVPADRLVAEGCRLLESLRENDAWQVSRERRQQSLDLGPDQLHFTFGVAEGFIKQKTKGQYPAPLLALKAIREGANLPLVEALKIEQKVALELVGSPTSANLIAIFFMKNKLARDPGVANARIGPRQVNRVGVLGAGLMGAGIATANARSGIPTALVDVDDAHLAAGLDRARDVVLGRIKIGRATPQDMAAMLSALSTSTALSAFADADLVIEAVPEDERLKTEAYQKIAPFLRDDAILATNTSTISITRMAEAAPNAERFVGMHFFYPVDRMELVEVVRGTRTSDETVATTVALAKRIRKTPIVVKDCAGFLVNRVLFPYMGEALRLLQEGVAMDAIDRAATQFGMPMGPIALADMVGLDTAFFATKVMARAYPDRMSNSPILAELVGTGHLGKKTGSGFWKYKGKEGKPDANPAAAAIIAKHREGDKAPERHEITERLFFPMLLEAVRVLEEGIVREPADVDMGLILGTGFPPFRGGILRWCDSEGASATLERLARYQHLGKQYDPPEMLKDQARSGAAFYPRPKSSKNA